MSCYSQDPARAERLAQFVLKHSPRFRGSKPTPVSYHYERPALPAGLEFMTEIAPAPEAIEGPPEAAASAVPDAAAEDEIAAGEAPEGCETDPDRGRDDDVPF
jgi:hypothetical protein